MNIICSHTGFSKGQTCIRRQLISLAQENPYILWVLVIGHIIIEL